MSFNHLAVDLLKISAEAIKSKIEDPKVINATVGVFLGDYKNLYSFPSVTKTIKSLDETKIRNYMVSDGGKEYVQNVLNYVLGNNSKLAENFFINANWSSGGSGALYMAMAYYNGKDVLLPNSRWPNYDNVCQVLNKNIIEYNLIKDNHFDLNSIAEILTTTKEKELLILINDPAHNPTGYNMSIKEYTELIDILNQNDKTKISLLIDLAYIDFSSIDYRKEIMPLLINLKEHVDIYLAFSGSKAFGVYGFRLGALINLTKNSDKSDKFKKLIYKKAEAIYGPPTSISIVFFNEIVKNEDVYNDRVKSIKILKNRSDSFIKELKTLNLETYPYNDGFFLTVKTNNPFKLTEKLIKSKCYVVPTYNGLRIALSAINEKEIITLAEAIKENI